MGDRTWGSVYSSQVWNLPNGACPTLSDLCCSQFQEARFESDELPQTPLPQESPLG